MRLICLVTMQKCANERFKARTNSVGGNMMESNAFESQPKSR